MQEHLFGHPVKAVLKIKNGEVQDNLKISFNNKNRKTVTKAQLVGLELCRRLRDHSSLDQFSHGKTVTYLTQLYTFVHAKGFLCASGLNRTRLE
jgi:hypothetical protein